MQFVLCGLFFLLALPAAAQTTAVNPQSMRFIESLGQIAVAYVEWAGSEYQRTSPLMGRRLSTTTMTCLPTQYSPIGSTFIPPREMSCTSTV